MELLNPLSDPQFDTVAIAYGTVQTSAPWPAGPEGVLVWSTTDCYVRVGSGAATIADCPIPAHTPIPFKVPVKGVPWTVSVVQIATAGNLYCKPINAA